MPESDLTTVQRATLLVLAAEAREVTNPELQAWKVDLRLSARNDLARQKLITVKTDSKPYRLELTDKGWNRCYEEFDAEIPAHSGALVGALYAVLKGIAGHLERSGIGLAEVFSDLRPAESAVPNATDLDRLIRDAYDRLVRRPGTWIGLADLRAELGRVDRERVDDALVRLSQAPDVVVEPEANQKTLTQRDRRAAVVIGNQDNHLIKIGT